MPGYVMHLATAKRILGLADITDSDYIERFMLGNVVPDTRKRTAKKESHYWTDEGFKRFIRRPDIDAFEKEYSRSFADPYVFGYYCHLYLDAGYLDRYWRKHFVFLTMDGDKAVWYDETKKVYLIDDGSIYDVERFFSDEFYYGDYDRINSFMLSKYGIEEDDLVIPDYELPCIGGIRITEVTAELSAMKSLIGRDRGCVKDSKLAVLDIEDIEKLIEKTAQELSEKLRAVNV